MAEYFKGGLIGLLLAFSLLFSMVFVAPQVYAAAIISHPGGTTIDVDWGEAFLLRHRLEWSESGEKGYYSTTIYWDCFDNKPSENFTFENASACFDNGDVIESTLTFREKPVGTGTRYTVNVRNATGDFGDGQFTVDIWLRAAGAGGVPHSATDNHPIYYSGIDIAESSIISEVPSPITVRVHELSALIYPSDDADVYERYPDSNYGSSTSIWVSPYDNRKNRGFLKFGLSEIPSGAIIRQAKLYLHCWRKEYDNFDAACCGVENDNWSENTITWNNQPNYSISLDDQEIMGVGWYAWDVTVFVAEEFSGDNVISFCLKGAVEPHGGRALFDSKEWRDNHPYLEVKYTLSARAESQLKQSEENDFLPDIRENSGDLKGLLTSLPPHDPIYINGNAGFTKPDPVNGGGSGTEDDPYIIENWDISSENARAAIEIWNTTAYFIIRNCYVHDGVSGIYFENVENGKIDNVESYNNAWGISLDNGIGSDNNVITNCVVRNNIWGIHSFAHSDNNVIINSTFENNSYYGIVIDAGYNNIVENCVISNNGIGIYLLGASYHDNVVSNRIISNNVGLKCDTTGTNYIYHNNFVNNENQAIDMNFNCWDDGYPSGGNYWSDYTGVDYYWGEKQDMPGSDGIGDTPYNILGHTPPNRDRYPLMNPFPLPWTGTAVWKLENLYKVSLNANLWIYQGSRLVVKFYTYDNTFENESVFEVFTPPAHVVKFDNVPHPGNKGVKRVRLDLTTDNSENVISTIASFVADRGILWGRLSEIRTEWPFATPEERSALWTELSDLRLQWSYAPS